MNYYPVIIPTLNRFEHFKRCVESLSINTHAEKTELVIGLDYPPSEKYVQGYNKIKAFIPTISGFAKVTVFEHTSNLGSLKNFRKLKEYVFSKYDAFISTEDDNVFSPCFLDYVNKCLDAYKNNMKIRSVTGFTHPAYYNASKPLIFCYDSSAWGMGQWRDKEFFFSNVPKSYFTDLLHSLKATLKVFYNYPLLLSNLLSMVIADKSYGDTKRTCLNIMNDTYQVRPYISLVKNIGVDGTGEHCKADDQAFFENQEILDLKEFPFEKMEPSLSVSKRMMWKFSLTPNTMNKIKIILASFYFYGKYRLKGDNK